MAWQDFAPKHTSRQRERIEWSINYAFNAPDLESPRVLLIGDSICNAYSGPVREKLDGRVNVSFWASSKCVTDPDYFSELDRILDAAPYTIITFNNGLHSLTTNRDEWTAAYAGVLDFIRAKLPDTLLSVVLSTPFKDSERAAVCAQLNALTLAAAQERALPVIDLFTPMDVLNREVFWRDACHFRLAAVDMQAQIIADHVLERAQLRDAAQAIAHASSELGPDGAIR